MPSSHHPREASSPDDHQGRDGPDVGDETGGEGAEFVPDAADDDAGVDAADGEAWFAAHGTDPQAR
jgi:hypothetical protein